MEHQTITAEHKKTSVTRLTRNSRIFKAIIKAIQDKKGEAIVSLDLKKIPEAVADYFIVCTAASSTQVKAIADNIEYEVKEQVNEMPYKQEGRQSYQWVLVDYINIVVHVMQPEPRKFYRLEEMWSDAPSLEHK